MKRSPIQLIIAAVAILIFGLLLFTYQVRRAEVAVVTLFGKVVDEKTEPGLAFRWPWPVEKVDKLDQRIQNFEDKDEQVKLADQNTLMVQVYVGWHIVDPTNFYKSFQYGSTDVAQQRLEEWVRNAKNEVAGRHVFSDFISTDTNLMKYPEIEGEIQKRLEQDVTNLQYGLGINFVQIKRIALPESVTKTVFDRMTSERQFYISQIDSSGEEAATKIKSKADSDAAKTIADADADAIRIRGQGEEEMMHSLSVLQQNTNLALLNLHLDALSQLVSNRATLILDQSAAPLNMLQPIPPQKFDSNSAPAEKNP